MSIVQLRWHLFAPAITLHYALFMADLPATCVKYYPNYPWTGACLPIGTAALTILGLVLPLRVGRYLDDRQRRAFALQHRGSAARAAS